MKILLMTDWLVRTRAAGLNIQELRFTMSMTIGEDETLSKKQLENSST
jgi:hypothetical protein